MKYLLVKETRMDEKEVTDAIEKNTYAFYYLQIVQRGRLQIVFPKEDLTEKLVSNIAQDLHMNNISIGKEKAIIHY